MKKLLSIILTAALLLGFTACGQNEAVPTWQEQYEFGIRYLSEGNYEEAIIAFNAAIEIDPKQAEAYIGLADVYIAQGDLDSAAAVLTKALEAAEDAAMIQARLDEVELARKTADTPTQQPENESVTESESTVEAEPEVVPDSVPELEPVTEPKAEQQPAAETEPVAEPEPTVEGKTEAKSNSEEVILQAGKSYRFTSDKTVMVDASFTIGSGRCDVVQYTGGRIFAFYYNTRIRENLMVVNGGETIVTVRSGSIKVHLETTDANLIVEEVDTPALATYTLSAGKNYQIENSVEIDYSNTNYNGCIIKVDRGGATFDFTMYNENDEPKKSQTDATTFGHHWNGEKTILTVHEQDVVIYTPYTYATTLNIEETAEIAIVSGNE